MTTGSTARPLLAIAFLTAATAASAQTPSNAEPASAGPLALYFDSGSASVRDRDVALLDRAARLYREGSPIVMVVAGSTDSVGSPAFNLRLSQRRAEAVLDALTARGIPAGRFQVTAKGETEPAVATGDSTAEERNRRVEITWR